MNKYLTNNKTIHMSERFHEPSGIALSDNILTMTRSGITFELQEFQEDNPEHLAKLKAIEKALDHLARRLREILPRSARFPQYRFVMQRDSYHRGLYYTIDRKILIFMIHFDSEDWKKLCSVMAHEYGHDVFELYAKKDARKEWSEIVQEDATCSELLNQLEKDKDMLRDGNRMSKYYGKTLELGQEPTVLDVIRYYKKEGPTEIYLQLFVLMERMGVTPSTPFDKALDTLNRRKSSIVKILSQDPKRDLRGIPDSPTSLVGSKNPMEAFCEAFALYVTYGPRTVLPKVRSWMKFIIPAADIVTSNLMKANSESESETPVVLVDLDGTIASVAWRLPLIEESPDSPRRKDGKFVKDYEQFHSSMRFDPVIPDTMRKIKDLHDSGYEIVYLSGRPEKFRAVTQTWLRAHDAPIGRLYLKPNKQDNVPAVQFKENVLKRLKSAGENIVMGVDDDADNINMYKKNGLEVDHVRDPGFTPRILQMHDDLMKKMPIARVLVRAANILAARTNLR